MARFRVEPLAFNPPLNVSFVTGVFLSGTTVFNQETNAGALVGAVTVTTTGGPYGGQVVLGGPDAAKFALTNGGFLPTNLIVGANNLPPGNYSITLTAS